MSLGAQDVRSAIAHAYSNLTSHFISFWPNCFHAIFILPSCVMCVFQAMIAKWKCHSPWRAGEWFWRTLWKWSMFRDGRSSFKEIRTEGGLRSALRPRIDWTLPWYKYQLPFPDINALLTERFVQFRDDIWMCGTVDICLQKTGSLNNLLSIK